MSTSTLTSLAILRVNLNQGNDYLDYLRPFILQILVEHKPDPVTIGAVSYHIRTQFGLEIPKRTVEIVLKRISKSHPLKREHGVYRITGDLPDPQITTKKSKAKRHIDAIVHGLQQFSQDTSKAISGPDDAVVAICAFLAKFDITCLRAYLRGTAIPQRERSHRIDIVLVSNYIQHLQRTDPERFDSFLVLVQGHMLANALLCPDLHNVSGTFRKVTFYFDTPLLVQILGTEGESRQSASCELIALINKLGGRVATFSHSYQELQNVLRGAADHVDSTDGRGLIVREARKLGTTRADLLLLAASIDDKLRKAGIDVEVTPRYIEDFQIDETVFEQVLEDEVNYHNPRAKEYDINSVRSIYTIRGNRFAPSLEKARAIFVTSNAAFAKAAWEYGQQYESAQDVSAVISDFSLANVAWLKAPMGAPSIPKTQLLALSYAALEPSNALLSKYLTEVDRLEKKGIITERDHQLLRSSHLVYDELMRLTLGDDASLTEETVTQTLERVSNEIKKEESKELTEEQEKHQRTLEELDSQTVRNEKIRGNIYWRCRRNARVLAWLFLAPIGLILVVGLLVAGIGLRSTNPILRWGFIAGSIVATLWTLMNLFFGSTVKGLHGRLQNRLLTCLLKRESKAIGVDLSESSEAV